MSADAQGPLGAATRLGPYEILAPLGVGGMGEVYSARDTRLDRSVAIKVLPAHLAADPGLRARLEREAKSISSLNHPHICTLHDVGRETVDGREIDYLVLELLDGESLADRLARSALSMPEALRYGIEVASALDAAHQRGVVHRDLKPGNVMLTRSGAKLLDFGLAKMNDADMPPADLSSFRTVDKPLTEFGTILGTFQYMAPEQLEGQPADARTDIFALGVLLYEMATGRKAFTGQNRTSLIAAIVSSQPPPISSLQELAPPALDHVIRKCLEKTPDDRWQSARDVAAQLRWINEGGSRVGLPAVVLGRRRTRERLAWGLACAGALAAAGFAVAWVRRAPEPAALVRFTIPTPSGLTAIGSPAVSPDGRLVAFAATDTAGKRQVWVRPLDAYDARVIPGTEGVLRPFWSPDSRFIAFIAGGKLRKVDVAGGPPQTLCDAPGGADGSWSESGVILFDGGPEDPIWSVSANGGVARVEVPPLPGSGSVGVGWPHFLPGGQHFLYVTYGQGTEDRTLMVRALGESQGREIAKTGSRVVYAPPGHLLFVRERTLVAQPFDTKALALTGDPIPLGEGVGVGAMGLASFSASRSGVIVFRASAQDVREFIWVDRAGKELGPATDDAGDYGNAWMSPDGRRLVYDSTTAQNADIWIRDLERGVSSRFTFEPAQEFNPIWSADGRRVIYSQAGKAADLMIKDASGIRESELLLASPHDKFASDVSRDGRYLLYFERKGDHFDLLALPMEGTRTPLPVATTRFQELVGSFSPSGRLVAYASDQSGRNEVYVQDFPEPRDRWQISTAGGTEPHWRGDGRELFYRQAGKVYAVPVTEAGGFKAGQPQFLFQARVATSLSRSKVRPTADGQRYLVLAAQQADSAVPVNVMLNWSRLLKP